MATGHGNNMQLPKAPSTTTKSLNGVIFYGSCCWANMGVTLRLSEKALYHCKKSEKDDGTD